MNPLSPDEIDHLDATLLPALERHHLRLLAHALRTLQLVQQHHSGLPSQEAIATWLVEQPGIDGDAGFAATLATQLHGAGTQLQQLAQQQGRQALELELDDLITWAQHQADLRLATDASAAHPAAPAAPPADH